MVEVIFRKNLHINYISDLKKWQNTQDENKKKVIPQVCSSIEGVFQMYY